MDAGAATPLAAPGDHQRAVEAAVATARSLLGQREISVAGSRFGDDCVALVRASLAGAGAPLPHGTTTVATLHALARQRGLLKKGAPSPGDLVFLADRPGGGPAHVGLVESVGPDRTALVLHRTGRGVARLRLNADQPWKLRGDGGRLLNDPLVTGAGKLPAGRLFLAWASIL
jgi:cell wall-associated NlpC family hydrolase